jgi:hypothetical protein
MDSGPAPSGASRNDDTHLRSLSLIQQNFFTIPVDAMFTTFREPLFTKVFDAVARKCFAACVWRARIAD